MNRKKILYLMKVSCLASSLLINPIKVEGKEKENLDAWSKAKYYGEKLYDWCVKVDDYVNEHVVDPIGEKASEVEMFKKDSLWLITNEPSIDPSLGRHYFFIDKNTPSIKKRTFYNEPNGLPTKKEGRYEEEKEMYVSLNDIDEVFLMKTTLDHETNTFTKNYVDLDSKNLYDENATAKYGRFVHIEDMVPESMIKEKYSKEDLTQIVNFLEQKLSQNLKLEKK